MRDDPPRPDLHGEIERVLLAAIEKFTALRQHMLYSFASMEADLMREAVRGAIEELRGRGAECEHEWCAWTEYGRSDGDADRVFVRECRRCGHTDCRSTDPRPPHFG